MNCPSCGAPNREEARFCDSCGAALGAAPVGREQRKVVTVLFCDVAGSTTLGERLDPEALRELMSSYFEVARTAIERHGGTLEKFIGDAVMAVFGVPTVREDDALRAVRAAEELRAAVEIEVRIGVNTGEVVTGTGDTLVTGDAVNVAARLEQAAETGEVLLGEATYRLVRGAVDVELLPPIAAKGKAEPLTAYRLRAVTGDVAVARRQDAPLVGRERERRMLADAWERSRTEGACSLFTILGTPGVGKSRLSAEFLAGFDATTAFGRCLPYGDGITYWPVVEVVKQLLGNEKPGSGPRRARRDPRVSPRAGRTLPRRARSSRSGAGDSRCGAARRGRSSRGGTRGRERGRVAAHPRLCALRARRSTQAGAAHPAGRIAVLAGSSPRRVCRPGRGDCRGRCERGRARLLLQELGRVGERGIRSTVGGELGECLARRGELDEAEAILDEAIGISTPDDYVTVAAVMMGRAFVALGRGDHTCARALAAEAVAITDGQEQLTLQQEARLSRAELLLQAGAPGEARVALLAAREVAERKGSIVVVAKVDGLLAGLA